MSLWKRIACNPEVEQRMTQFYDEKGLGEIRICFAQWIEDRIMSEGINTSTVELYKQNAHQFYEDLKQKLITLSNDNLIKFKLPEICTHITQTTAVDLYTYLRTGLQKEIQLLEQMPQNQLMRSPGDYDFVPMAGQNGFNLPHQFGVAGNPGMMNIQSATINSMNDELSRTVDDIQKLNNEVRHSMRLSFQQYHNRYENFRSALNDSTQNQAMMTPQQMSEREQFFNDQYKILHDQKAVAISQINRSVEIYVGLQGTVIEALKKWQRNQALSGNGAKFYDNLDDIQKCIELLIETICELIQLIVVSLTTATDAVQQGQLNELQATARKHQQLLVLSSFIVEKQPPQVMKTNTRFAATVRWLIGPQLGICMNSPNVECVILSEAQAQRHSTQVISQSSAANGTSAPPTSGEILNNVSTMEYQQNSRVFSASFRNMQLKKIKRAEKKGTESVMDEKFALLFYTQSIVNDYKIRVWTLSLPVVVIVHGNQEPQSWATITWDNAFSDISREPFQVPDKVSWSQLAYALNTKFGSATGRQLTEENLHFLYEKLFRNDSNNMVSCDQKEYISWAQFCKEPLPDRNFTFWEWFFATMKLTKDHFQALWQAGLVVGFIDKNKSIESLSALRVGTFLIRFSDSELGAITITFKREDGQVLHLQPWPAKDLNIRGLADRINDLTCLDWLYPNELDKHTAFRDFYTPAHQEEQRPRVGYVPNTIRAHVPTIEGNSTPQHQVESPHPNDIAMTNDFNNYNEFAMYFNSNTMTNGNGNGNSMSSTTPDSTTPMGSVFSSDFDSELNFQNMI